MLLYLNVFEIITRCGSMRQCGVWWMTRNGSWSHCEHVRPHWLRNVSAIGKLSGSWQTETLVYKG